MSGFNGKVTFEALGVVGEEEEKIETRFFLMTVGGVAAAFPFVAGALC
jgi:hypothetical protein